MNFLRELLGPTVFKAFAVHYVLLGTVVVLVVVFWQLDHTFGTFSFFLPLLAAGGLWLIAEGQKTKADHRAFKSLQGKEPPRPGAWTAICGKAIALDPNTDTPFKDVLAFRYQVFDRKYMRKGAESSPDIGEKRLTLRRDGYYLAPTGIETDSGVVALAGFPDLKNMEKRSLPSGAHSRADEIGKPVPHYLPPFVARALTVAKIRDQGEAYIKYGDEEEASEGRIKSWVLPASEPVCVFGVWNEGELVPSSKRPDGLPVYEGEVKDMLANLKDTSSGLFGFGGVLLAVCAVWVIWALI